MKGRLLLLALAVLVVIAAAAGVVSVLNGDGAARMRAILPADPAVSDGSGGPDIHDIGPVTTPGGSAPAMPFPDAAGDKEDHGAPGVESSISKLAAIAAADGPDAAADFAAERGLKLRDSRVQVVLETADAAGAATEVTAAGGAVEAAHDGLVQASIPVEGIDELADSPRVTYIREPAIPALSTLSEGVADISADVWQSGGSNGAGVKVAVVDLGFQDYQNLVASGELPASVTTASFRTDGDITGGGEKHGSACAELLYDVAPGAQLYLVNFSTDVELANAIDYLIAQDIDVVSASWSFFGNFRGDGQGAVNDMVQNAVDSGIFWANVSGNAAQDHWSGAFTDADADSWHDFADGDEGNDINVSAGARIDAYLSWNDWPVSDQDYDMYLVYEGNPNQAVAAGDSWQSGTQAPSEQIHYNVPPGKGGRYWIAITNYSATGDATFKLYTYPYELQYQTPAGSLAGQPTDSPYVMTVGAVPVGSMTLESFSSRGPTVDGRTKPDIVAPDRVSTVSYGITAFWGTSAAAPHAAGAGALVKGENPVFTPAQVQGYLEARALDLGDPGKDDLFGSGRLDLGPAPDTSPPVVSNVQPAGELSSTSATISADYQDTGSGIDTASVSVTLDGNPLSGCAVTDASVSCPVSGLSGGVHAIGGSVSDNAGNPSPISGSFDVKCFEPLLSLGSPSPFWASYQDYVDRQLSVTYSFCNSGGNDALGVEVVGTVSTNGVLFLEYLPAPMGDLGRATDTPTCSEQTFRYLVPHGVAMFKTSTYVTANDSCDLSYSYPGPFINPGG